MALKGWFPWSRSDKAEGGRLVNAHTADELAATRERALAAIQVVSGTPGRPRRYFLPIDRSDLEPPPAAGADAVHGGGPAPTTPQEVPLLSESEPTSPEPATDPEPSAAPEPDPTGE